MSRSRTIQIAALNIAMHTPHSSARYVDLLFDAFWLNERIKLSNVHYAMIGSLYQDNPDDDTSPISGEFFRFVKIDPNEPWFNELTKEPATDLEKNEINIPSHLLSNLQRIPFVFLPQKHRLYVITKDKKDVMGASTVKRILDPIFDRVTREKNYPEVAVTVIPSEESVDRILSIANLERLSLEFERPNADDDNELEQLFMKQMEKENASKVIHELIATKNNSLEPSNKTKRLARLASQNGKVTGYGRNEYGTKVTESTDKIPHIKHVPVDTDIETARDVLNRVANNWEDS